MGVEMRLSAIPVNLTHAATRALEKVELAAETACVAVYRARLDEPGCLDRVDLATAGTIMGWLEVVRLDADSDGARVAVRHRLRRALDAIAEWPRELTVFHDPISDRRWLMSGGVTSGDLPTEISYELDLLAESGLCDRAVTVAELDLVLDQRGRLIDGGQCGWDAPAWDVEDDRVAAAEGWGLFETGREPFVEVQRFDAADPGEEQLGSDTEAWDCLLDGLMRGSVAHARAFSVVLAYAPMEAADIVARWAVLHQPGNAQRKDPARPTARRTGHRPTERPGPQL